MTVRERERWLTVAEIAERLQVSEVTVRRWLREGALHGRQLGGRAGWRVAEAELERFMQARAGSERAEAQKGASCT
jgi:excisionase family DNA binding protein